MKKAIMLVYLLVAGVGMVRAQVDTSRTKPVDTVAVTNQNFQYTQELPKDIGPPKDSVLVTEAAIPPRLRRRLEQGEQYRGWEGGEIYLNRNTGLYVLYLKDGVTTNVYGFDRRGKPVTVTSFTRKVN